MKAWLPAALFHVIFPVSTSRNWATFALSSCDAVIFGAVIAPFSMRTLPTLRSMRGSPISTCSVIAAPIDMYMPKARAVLGSVYSPWMRVHVFAGICACEELMVSVARVWEASHLCTPKYRLFAGITTLAFTHIERTIWSPPLQGMRHCSRFP